MHTPEQVLDLFAHPLSLIRKSNGKNLLFCHDKALKYKKKMMPHFDVDYFPKDLFSKRAPNQTQQEADYIECNYKGITNIVWSRYMSAIGRIWNDANWSVNSWGKVPQTYIDAGYNPQDYFESEYPEFISLENYFKTIVLETKQQDPNAVLVVKPKSIPVKETAEGYVYDDSQIIEPVAYIFDTERTVHFCEDYFIGFSEVCSIVEFGGKKVREGYIFEFYDKENIYLIKQIGKKNDWQFEVELWWSHGLGYLPCKKLQGIPEYYKGDIIYKSKFLSAVEPLDIALLDSANLLIAKARHVFPKFWEYQTDCDNVHKEYGACQGGHFIDNNGDRVKCSVCNGTGKKSMSPMGTYVVPMPDRLNPEVANVSLPPAGYINPEITTPEFLVKEIDKNLNRAASILNLDFSNSDVQGGETALGKQIDREELFSVLLNESSQTFHLFEFTIDTILGMRYMGIEEYCSVNYPKNFSIRTENDLTIEISKAKESGMPDVGIRQLIIEYYNTRFTVSEHAKKIIDLVFFADRLVTLSNQDIQVKLASGSIAKWEDILHTSIYQFIEVLLNENETFLDLELEEQYAKVVEMAKAKENEITPKAINNDQILANANA